MINILKKWYSRYKKTNIPKVRLWLDDIRDPKDPNIQKRFGAKGDEIWVKTQSEAINCLMSGNVEYISLDCDLGENGGTGYKVAEWIEEMAYKKALSPIDWNVHSQNTVEAMKSIQALVRANIHWNLKK